MGRALTRIADRKPEQKYSSRQESEALKVSLRWEMSVAYQADLAEKSRPTALGRRKHVPELPPIKSPNILSVGKQGKLRIDKTFRCSKQHLPFAQREIAC